MNREQGMSCCVHLHRRGGSAVVAIRHIALERPRVIVGVAGVIVAVGKCLVPAVDLTGVLADPGAQSTMRPTRTQINTSATVENSGQSVAAFCRERGVTSSDLDGAFLTVAATGVTSVRRRHAGSGSSERFRPNRCRARAESSQPLQDLWKGSEDLPLFL